MTIKLYDIRVHRDRVSLIDNAGASSNLMFEKVMFADDRSSVYKYLADIGRDLYDGTMRFSESSRCSARKVYENCKRRHGTKRLHFADGEYKKYRERFASEFARRMCA